MGVSFTFPGTKGLQAEFPELVPGVGDVWIDERFASGLVLAVGAAGYLAERRAPQRCTVSSSRRTSRPVRPAPPLVSSSPRPAMRCAPP